MSVEATTSFPCFGSRCSVYVTGGRAEEAVELIEASLRSCHDRFSRFDPASELSRFNADPRTTVPVSPMLARLAQGGGRGGDAHRRARGPDARAAARARGYASDHQRSASARHRPRPARRRAVRHVHAASAAGRHITVDGPARTISRPPGVTLDSGGFPKGLFADVVAPASPCADAYAIDCAGDLRSAAPPGRPAESHVDQPVRVRRGPPRASTWSTAGWRPAASAAAAGSTATAAPPTTCLIPSTGRPAFTGLIQVTALAPTALEAEARAKAALLSGPAPARAVAPPRRRIRRRRRPHRSVWRNPSARHGGLTPDA